MHKPGSVTSSITLLHFPPRLLPHRRAPAALSPTVLFLQHTAASHARPVHTAPSSGNRAGPLDQHKGLPKAPAGLRPETVEGAVLSPLIRSIPAHWPAFPDPPRQTWAPSLVLSVLVTPSQSCWWASEVPLVEESAVTGLKTPQKYEAGGGKDCLRPGNPCTQQRMYSGHRRCPTDTRGVSGGQTRSRPTGSGDSRLRKTDGAVGTTTAGPVRH
ncbi:hypothetical protein Cadr_000029447 [Camelus dromedarius]|uniref:Uncharacterized protein n=1 Tax=Camelus dromedarius TaxID=9838 RepID=A0A5N4C615_CAMDR|nr:hypothetical protein Cadr_000029447 [Camelus dromedarius]